MFFERTAKGLKIRVRLTPSGRRVCVDGWMQNVDGKTVLKATVTKAPEDGKANQALIKLLAKEWKIAKSTLDVIQGQTSRNKILLLNGDVDHLADILNRWVHQKGFTHE